jgi:hypothetical protein
VFAVGDEVLVVTSEGSESQVREALVGEPDEAPDDQDGPPGEDEDQPEPAEQRLQ